MSFGPLSEHGKKMVFAQPKLVRLRMCLHYNYSKTNVPSLRFLTKAQAYVHSDRNQPEQSNLSAMEGNHNMQTEANNRNICHFTCH